MRFVSTIFNRKNNGTALALLLLTAGPAVAQENSPYSRYGLGNLVPSQNVVNRAMGGISAAYFDGQSINTVNPASYAKFSLLTTFDIGLDIESRTLRNTNQTDKFSAANMLVNYLNIGVPLKAGRWGLNLGLRPISRINYKIERNSRIEGVDSIRSLYEGSGGTYQAFAGTGVAIKNFSVGVNFGYFFGRKEYTTRTTPVNDSVFYYQSKFSTQTNIGSPFIDAGVQYSIKLAEKNWLRLGAYGNLEQNLSAKRSSKNETFNYTQTGADQTIDSIYFSEEVKGDVVYPMKVGFGVLYQKAEKFLVGVDYEQTQWSNYRYFGATDATQDNWTLRVGAQILPNLEAKKYWGRVNYRAGFYTGPDYIIAEGRDIPNYGFTFGMGLPVRRGAYSTQFTIINTNFEIGRRGNNDNSLKESYFRVSLGLNLSDIWFRKRQYE